MRRSEREIKDIEEIIELVKEAKVLHLGLFDDEYPYVLPLHYGFEYADGCFSFYMHGAHEGHKFDLINKNDHVFVELENKFSLVEAEVACGYGALYKSFMGRGKIGIVSEPDEKIKGLKLLMLSQAGKEFEFNEEMANAVTVLKVQVKDFTAKARKS